MSGFLGSGAVTKVAIAATAAVVLLTAAAGAAGVLPLPGGGSDAADVAPAVVQSGDVPTLTPEPEAAPSSAADVPVSSPPVVAEAPPVTAAAPVASGSARPSSPAPAAPARTLSTPAPAAPPATAAGVARRTPSAAEVQAAIKALPQYIRTMIPPTPALVAEIGDQVCTAFDQGHTYAEVKTTGLQMLTQLPRTTVLPGGADWAVRTVVSMYCPGHASKLA